MKVFNSEHAAPRCCAHKAFQVSLLLKGILDQLNYLGGIGPLCTHVQVLATWTHLNGWLEHDVFAIGLQHSPQLEHFIACL